MKNLIRLIKQHKEIISYLFWGVMTTVVSWLSYSLFTFLFRGNMQVFDLFGMSMSMVVFLSNVLSCLMAITFAFVVNKLYVFQSKSWKTSVWLQELWKFISARIITGVVEIVAVPLLVGAGIDQMIFGIKGMCAKIIVSVLVVVLNYVFSKLFIFK